MSGNESELKIFSKFLYDSLEHREQGLSSRVNGSAMATAIQTGALVALIAEEDGKAICMQIWEIINNGIWFDTLFKVKNLRFQFVIDDDTRKHISLLHSGIGVMREDGYKLIASIDARDQFFEISNNCGLTTFAVTYDIG